MRLAFIKRSVPVLVAVAIAGCNSAPESTTVDSVDTNSTTDTTEIDKDSKVEGDRAQKPTEQPKSTPKYVSPSLQPGTYCYETSDEIEDISVRLVVDSSDRITGNVQGTIHNEEAGYYTSYRQAVTGTIDGSNLNVDIATWIEYDKQNAQETWSASPTALTMRDDTLAKASCEKVSKVFQNENGLEAKDLTQSANNVRTEQVYFSQGKSGTTVSNAVVRGDRDVYVLTAQGGQQMDLSITSLEDNAVFDVIDPSGIILGTEMTKETVFLPHTGDYEIIVGGTRGNATYELAIAID